MRLSCKQEIGGSNDFRAWRKDSACRHVFFPSSQPLCSVYCISMPDEGVGSVTWWMIFFFFELEDVSSNPLTKKTVFRKPPLVFMAVTFDARTLVFDFLVPNHNKLTRTEVTTTVCRKVDWRIFSAYPLKWTVVLFRGMEDFLQIDVSWCVLMSVSDIYFLFDVQGIIIRPFGIVVKAPLL